MSDYTRNRIPKGEPYLLTVARLQLRQDGNACCFNSASRGMLRALRHLLALAGASLLLFPMVNAKLQAQDLTYTNIDGRLTITGYTGPGGNVIIPATLDGFPVTAIGDSAFADRSAVTGITMPKGITSIGRWAFSGCTRLTNSTIPDQVTTLGDLAFFDCTSLTNIALPNGLANIGSYAFHSCTSLSSITIPDSVTIIGNGAFSICFGLTSVELPAGLTSIGDETFSGCFRLTSITIPESVTLVGSGAFSGCSGLTTLTLGDRVATLGSYAFSGCSGLTSSLVGKNLKSIGDAAFSWCTNLTGIYFKGNAPVVGSAVFDHADQAIVYYLPGTEGWSTPFAGRPAVLWAPHLFTIDSNFGARPNGFGFSIAGAPNLVVLVEACTNLADLSWIAVGTNTLASGSYDFTDREWTNFPNRFYRIRFP